MEGDGTILTPVLQELSYMKDMESQELTGRTRERLGPGVAEVLGTPILPNKYSMYTG